MKLPLFTKLGSSTGKFFMDCPNRQTLNFGDGITPSASTYGPCIDGFMEVQYCDEKGCVTRNVPCRSPGVWGYLTYDRFRG